MWMINPEEHLKKIARDVQARSELEQLKKLNPKPEAVIALVEAYFDSLDVYADYCKRNNFSDDIKNRV